MKVGSWLGLGLGLGLGLELLEGGVLARVRVRVRVGVRPQGLTLTLTSRLTSLRSSAMYADASTSACIPSGSAERLTLILPDTCQGKHEGGWRTRRGASHAAEASTRLV